MKRQQKNEYSQEISRIGIEKRYQEDNDFNAFCSMLDCLALLPLIRLQEGVDYIKSNILLAAEELFKYFDETYVSGIIRCINKQNTLSLTV